MHTRFGIAGLRHPHVENILAEVAGRSDVSVVAVADEETSIRESFGRRLGVPTYSHHEQMLAKESLDAVGVVTVNSERGRLVRDCLLAGKHVLSDKPLCTNLTDLASIKDTWRRSGTFLSVMLEKRFWPVTKAFEEILAAGEIGRLVLAWASGPHRLMRHTRPDWMFGRESYGGILNDLAVHDLDLLLRFTRAKSGFVQGFVGNAANKDVSEFEDHGQVLLRTDGGLLATIEVHWLSPEAAPYHGDYRMILTGTKGTAELHWARNELTVSTHKEPPRLVPLPPARTATGHFLDAISAGLEPRFPEQEALISSHVALIAQETANSGLWQGWRAAY